MTDQENDGCVVASCLHNKPASCELWKDETPLASMGLLVFLPAAVLILYHSITTGLEETCDKFLRESLTESSFTQVSHEKPQNQKGTILEEKLVMFTVVYFLMIALTVVADINFSVICHI